MADKIDGKTAFTLVEVLIYAAIFAVSAVFLIGILTAVINISGRQSSINEVNSQLSFINTTIQRLVRSASLVDMIPGVATTTLTLRMASATLDPTKIYVDDSLTAIYLAEGALAPVALTDSNVKVTNFLVTKYENPGGPTTVQVDLVLEYNTLNPKAKTSRTLKTAITKISAATFDSSILPNANNIYDIGNAVNTWKDAYFSGSLGVGTAPGAAAKLRISGDIGFSNSSAGIIFVSPGGGCFRLTLNNSGNVATSSISCP